MGTGEGQELLLLINWWGIWVEKGLGVAEGHLGSWKRPCGHFSPHPEYSTTTTRSWLGSTKCILEAKHRALHL